MSKPTKKVVSQNVRTVTQRPVKKQPAPAVEEVISQFKIVNDFKVEDHILAHLSLPDPCTVRVSIDPEHAILRVFVGQRDFQFSMETGEFVSSGTMMADSEAVGTAASEVMDTSEEDLTPESPEVSEVEEDSEKIVS